MPHDPTSLHIPDEHEPELPDPIEDPQTSAEERERAAFVVPQKLLIAVMLLLIVYLIAAALGLEITIFSSEPGQQIPPTPTRVFQEGNDGDVNSQQVFTGQPDPANEMAGPEGTPVEIYPVDPIFRSYWEQNGGVRIFGHAISPLLIVDGRRIQWFERARLEEWPEFAGTDFAVQPALLGREFTQGIDFPRQSPFPSQTDIWYFPETGHAVRGRFLRFWLENGGVKIFGYPISEEVREVLPSDGQIHVVQYFERARMEYHPQHKGTENEVMLGLLGRALYLNESKPAIIPESLVAPTPVLQTP